MHHLTKPRKPLCIQLCTVMFEANQLSAPRTPKLAISALIHYVITPSLSSFFTQSDRLPDNTNYDDGFV